MFASLWPLEHLLNNCELVTGAKIRNTLTTSQKRFACDFLEKVNVVDFCLVVVRQNSC